MILRRPVGWLIGLGVVVGSSSGLMAQPEAVAPEPRLVTVIGDGEVKVVPDEVVLMLGVETWDKDLAAAKAQNDERLGKILGLTAEHGIDPKQVQTDYISIEPRYRDSNEHRDFIGYVVHNNVVVTLRDLSQFEALLTGVLESGVNYVQGIRFNTTELAKLREEARLLALQAAREKATAMAIELGEEIGRPHRVVDEQSNSWSWYASRAGGVMAGMAEGAPGEPGATIAPGQILVTARVTVSFELK